MLKEKIIWIQAFALVAVAGVACWWFLPGFLAPDETSKKVQQETPDTPATKLTVLELGAQARKNLGLTSAVARPVDYWKTATIPGVIKDRPGVSDRGVTSPTVGVVSALHAYPGDTVRPGEALVTIQIFSEYLQATQTQLYKAKQEIALLQAELERLSGLAETGAIAGSRIISLNNDILRQTTLVQAARQELLTRGLNPRQVEAVEGGSFVATIQVPAPPAVAVDVVSPGEADGSLQAVAFPSRFAEEHGVAYEVQELSVELGQTVQAGQLLASLANHQLLYVVGHAFKREAAYLEQAAKEKRPLEIEFADDPPARWPPHTQVFRIRHLANSIDPDSRTLDFFVPLTNQSHTYEAGAETFVVWRFRPGQRTRIYVPVEMLSDVFVLPAEAVVDEGPQAFVFRQNGDLFKQIPVHVLHQDRRHSVIANDGSITPGTYLAQNSAASLNRVLKAQSASGEQPGLHVHPDGTVHAAH